MEELKITETLVVDKIIEYLVNSREKGRWKLEKTRRSDLHGHGPDIVMTGGTKNGERFIIECKGKSYSKSARAINSEGWLNALGQIITRMNTQRIINSGKTKGRVNYAYKYGLGLCKKSAEIALNRIPKQVAKVLNLHIFSCDDEGNIEMFTPSQFKKD